MHYPQASSSGLVTALGAQEMEGARFLESGERGPSRKQTAGAVIYSNPAEGRQGHTQT